MARRITNVLAKLPTQTTSAAIGSARTGSAKLSAAHAWLRDATDCQAAADGWARGHRSDRLAVRIHRPWVRGRSELAITAARSATTDSSSIWSFSRSEKAAAVRSAS